MTPASATGPTDKSGATLRAELAQKERASFEQAAKQIRDTVASDPALADLGRQLAVDITPEGLRIQILNEDKQAMFASGSAVLNDRAGALLLKVAPVLMKLPERLSITGHTDASPYRGSDRSNWELSAERANADPARRAASQPRHPGDGRQRLLAGAVAVSDAEVIAAMAFAFTHLKLVMEPGGAVALAALLSGRHGVKGQVVGIVISGGNVDPAVFSRALA